MIITKPFFLCKNYDFNLSDKCPNYGQGVRTSGTLPFAISNSLKYTLAANKYKYSGTN